MSERYSIEIAHLPREGAGEWLLTGRWTVFLKRRSDGWPVACRSARTERGARRRARTIVQEYERAERRRQEAAEARASAPCYTFEEETP